MPAYYTVVQYVPDPVIDERINIGVIVLDGDRLRCRFISNWQRVRAFGAEDISFLRDFVQQIKEDCEPQHPLMEPLGRPKLTSEQLRRMAGDWMNSIQFTDLRASLLEPAALLEDVSQRFLRVPQSKRHQYRDRQTAVKIATQHVQEALRQRIGPMTEHIFHRNFPLQGNLEEHKFDFGVANGRPLVAGRALSFEGPENTEHENALDATKWAIVDVKSELPDLQIVIFALPPKGPSKTFQRAVEVFQGLRTAFVTEHSFDIWSQRIAELAERAAHPF